MDDQLFRQAMGKFATGVTVITTETEGEVHGMTANAFMSVSLNPKLVLISIDKRARMLEKIEQANKFAVSILAEEQKRYSQIFAGQEKGEVTFARLNDMPVIGDALVNVTCNVYNKHEEGDHYLFVGEVTDIAVQDGDPLLFFSGQYNELPAEKSTN